ncbi:dihydrofolate reductase family protein [Actinoplanes sp. CA-142083]|uniref:dihydrofolate reductase family protein n=1 Tax=Actinoplanes sp. CA-142083 TaxID=3239903 RepID=UPI003D8F19A5
MTASVDGRIALRRDDLLMHPPAAGEWAALQPPGFAGVEAQRSADIGTRHGPQAELAGSGSLVPSPSPSPSLLPPSDDPALYDDFVVSAPGREKWFAVIDGRGRVRWTIKRVGTSDLLVLACRATPSGYLAYLRREGISYLIAGEERVDLAAALLRMRSRLGVTCVVSTGGGGLNGALLRAGLVDELQVVVLPAVIGGLGTPTLFDGPPLGAGESPLPLRLLSAQTSADGTLWLRYETGLDGETATEGGAGG